MKLYCWNIYNNVQEKLRLFKMIKENWKLKIGELGEGRALVGTEYSYWLTWWLIILFGDLQTVDSNTFTVLLNRWR